MTVSRLSYLDSQDSPKPPVLFLHGFLGNALDWTDVAGDLSDQFRTIAVDLPGHGKSVNLPKYLHPIEGCAKEVISLLDSLNLEKVSVVGYSMGGRVALYVAQHFPERIERVLLESATPGIREENARRERIAYDEVMAVQLESVPFDIFLRDWYQQPLFSSVNSRPELFEELLKSRSNGSPSELAKSLRAMGTGNMEPLWDGLSSLSMPTLCMAGELDPKFAALAREMAVLIPNCHPLIIPDSGHIVHLEQPDTYIARVRAFLEA